MIVSKKKKVIFPHPKKRVQRGLVKSFLRRL